MKKKFFGVYLCPQDLELIGKAARERGESMAVIIREAIKYFLKTKAERYGA